MKYLLQNTTPATSSLDSTPHFLQGSRGRLEGVLDRGWIYGCMVGASYFWVMADPHCSRMQVPPLGLCPKDSGWTEGSELDSCSMPSQVGLCSGGPFPGILDALEIVCDE